MSVLCVLGFCSESSPAVPEQALQDVRGSWGAEHGPLDASVFEVAAVDLVGAEPLFDALLDAVALGEADGARSRRETVVYEVHRILNREERRVDKGEMTEPSVYSTRFNKSTSGCREKGSNK